VTLLGLLIAMAVLDPEQMVAGEAAALVTGRTVTT
jgi:hypothetical protein